MKKCAIYTRKSSSKGLNDEFTSLDAQRDACLNYIASQKSEGWVVSADLYDDGGFTGANMERPNLEKLLSDIQKGRIDCVVVYKVDRLSRSLFDFCKLLEFFDKRGVTFVSVTQHFNTNTSMGRLTLNILLSFAQFEREMISERTRDKMLARAERGMWNGGYMPFGYIKEGGKLLVDKGRAKIVREIFEGFVTTGSLKQTTDFVIKKEVKNPKTGKQLSMNGVFHILRNPAYIGQMVWSGKVYQGSHEPIISKELFEHAQSLTKEKKIKKLLYKEFFVRGLIKCGECGSTMTPSFTNKKKRRYYYYKCYQVVRNGRAACSIKEVNAEKLENFLIENLCRIAQDKQYVENLAFKITHESPAPTGFELPKESSKNLATRISQVLMEFKNKIQKATQVEKCLIFRRTIQGIKFSRDFLEVLIFLEDTRGFEAKNFLNSGSGKLTAETREGAVNPDAPACSTSSILKYGESVGSPSNSKLILPHHLTDRTRFTC